MPIYEYQCQKCNAKMEFLQKMGENARGLSCPSCGSVEIKKIISAHMIGKSVKTINNPCGSSGCNVPGGCCSGGSCGMH